MLAQQTFRQRDEFRAGIRAPSDAAIRQESDNRATHGSAQRLHTVAGLEAGGLAEFFQDLSHRIAVQHTGHVMGHRGSNFPAASGGQIGEEGGGELTDDVREGIAVEEEERRLAMAVPEEV